MSKFRYTANLNLHFSEEDFKLSPYLTNLIESRGAQPSKAACFILTFTERDGCLIPHEDLWNQLYDVISDCSVRESPPAQLTSDDQREASLEYLYQRLVSLILWADQDERTLKNLAGRLLGTWGHEYDRFDPTDPSFNKTTQELVEAEFGSEGQALLKYLEANQYLYPETTVWFQFWALLPVTEDTEGRLHRPAIPSPLESEDNRLVAFLEQLLYAERHGGIGPIAEHLRSLPAESWVKLSHEEPFTGKSKGEE